MSMSYRFLLSVVLLSTAAAPLQADWTGGVWWPESEGGNGHYYNVVRETDQGSGFTWSDAETIASRLGGGQIVTHLATLTSQEEHDFVYENLVGNALHWNGRQGPWIGLRQVSVEDEPAGGWEWVTEEPFDFVNWGPSEPNEFSPGENFGQFHNSSFITPSPGINDAVGDDLLPFVVEYEIPTLAEISSLRDQVTGSLVAFEGVVGNLVDTIDSLNFGAFHVQDDSGGVEFFASQSRADLIRLGIEEGDRVRVAGRIGSFRGRLQIEAENPIFSITRIEHAGIPEPDTVSISDLEPLSSTAEGFESRIVELKSVNLESGEADSFEPLTNYDVRQGETMIVGGARVSTRFQDLVGVSIPRGLVDLSGIFSQFDESDPGPGVTGVGYQIRLRSLDDVRLSGDFNNDRRVDAGDYTIWRDGFGTIYDIIDYQAWRSNFGVIWDTESPTVNLVPEPQADLAILIGAWLSIGSRPARYLRSC